MKARTNRCINKQQWINEGTNFPLSILAMVIILDGDSEIYAHVYIDGSHKSDFFIRKKPNVLHACSTCFELPSNISTRLLAD